MAGAWCFLLVCVAGMVALVGHFSGVFDQKRRAEYRRAWECHAFAQRHGLQYLHQDPGLGAPSPRAPFVEPVGASQTLWGAFHVMRGAYRGHQLVAYECRVKNADWESLEGSFQVVAIVLPADRPFLDISLENDLSRAFEEDLTFENRAFNDVFRVKSDSPRFAHDVLHARTMEWMLADWRARSFNWRFEGRWLMTFRSGGVNTAGILPYADFLIDLLAQVPEHVWSDR